MREIRQERINGHEIHMANTPNHHKVRVLRMFDCSPDYMINQASLKLPNDIPVKRHLIL